MHNCAVSILVLVESGLQWSSPSGTMPDMPSFNPCFSGIRSSMQSIGLRRDWYQSFNPCFSGIRSSISSYFRLALISICFNPCFSGIRSSIRSYQKQSGSGLRVSILVLVESGLQFEHIFLDADAAAGFNPCFSGIRSSITLSPQRMVIILKFQSLF